LINKECFRLAEPCYNKRQLLNLLLLIRFVKIVNVLKLKIIGKLLFKLDNGYVISIHFFNYLKQFVYKQVEHKKTFYYLEQLILKLNMHQNTVSIKQVSGKYVLYKYFFKKLTFFLIKLDGIDFFYANQQDARKMIDFFESVVPCR
jgi:hypothetical protein